MYNLISKTEEKNSIISMNNITKEKGLILTNKEIDELIENKNETLNNLGRVEITSIIDKIIYEFYDSSYIDIDNYFETINEIINIFYKYQKEFNNLTDEQILKYLKNNFETTSNGVIELLEDTSLLKEQLQEDKYE